MSALALAAREGLDNLVWVVNCNLHRLDGPVRGNSRVIDELEALFSGAAYRNSGANQKGLWHGRSRPGQDDHASAEEAG